MNNLFLLPVLLSIETAIDSYFSHETKKIIDNTEVKKLKSKILAMENSDREKDDLIKALEIKMQMQVKTIEESTLTEKHWRTK